MKRYGTALAVALVALWVTAGCNDYGNTFQVNTGASLTSLSPANIPANSGDLVLTVIGFGFVPKTVVQWDGAKLDTTVTLDVNGNVTNLTAKVPKTLTAQPGRHFVNTINPATNKQDNGLSNTIAFIVTVPANPQPTLTSISPTSATPGSPDVTLTLTGTNFLKASVATCAGTDGSIAQWNTTTSTTCLATTFTSATQMTATIPASLLTTESCATVTVFTGPSVDTSNTGVGGGGGGTSNAVTFTVSTNAAFCPAAAVANMAVTAAEETPAVSLDGRFVAFTGTPGTGTGAGAQSAHTQIFLRDTCEGSSSDCKPKTTVLSAAADGTEGNADSHSPSITSDGRYVAFSSAATNLASETPSGKQIFVRDTCQGAANGCTPKTELISVDPNGLLSATDNLLPSISSSGRFVAFLSVKAATTKIGATANGMNNGVRQVFVRDTCIGAASGCTPKTMRISTQPGDANVVGGKPAGPAMSSNGGGVGITDNHSATLFTRSVAVDDRVFLAITKEQK
jgi:trimeric autotransporter adhesin